MVAGRVKWPDIQAGVTDMARAPNLVEIPVKPRGIGGILRDCWGSWLIVFSESVGVADSNIKELLAIKEAMGFF
ncbi:hypothetical protein DITRI_Ditri08aG0029000 [Diplodiscus trichospermus]